MLSQSPRRTRYRLGAGGMVYLLFGGLLLGAALYTQANLVFWAFGLMIGGLVVSIALSWQVMRGIEVQRLMPSHGVVGETLVLRYQVHNRSWLPIFGLLIAEIWGKGLRGWRKVGPVADQGSGGATLLGQPVGWMLHLGPHQTGQAEAPCWPMIRGVLGFEQIMVSSAFPFNVICKTIVFGHEQQVLVYPALYRMNRRLIHSLAQLDLWGRTQLDRGGGSDEFFGLREYRQGDRMSMIDWKRSASHGELISRELTHPSPPRVMLLVDLSPARQRAAEQAAQAEAATGQKIRWGRPFRNRTPNPGSATSAAVSDQPPTKPQTQTNCQPSNARLSQERAIGLAASMICDAYLHGFQVGLTVIGPPGPRFPPHHSLPHRTRMLETLARLDLEPTDEQPGKANPTSNNSTVIITTAQPPSGGAATSPISPSRADSSPTVLYADHLNEYVTDADRDALLSRRVGNPTRRETMHLEG